RKIRRVLGLLRASGCTARVAGAVDTKIRPEIRFVGLGGACHAGSLDLAQLQARVLPRERKRGDVAELELERARGALHIELELDLAEGAGIDRPQAAGGEPLREGLAVLLRDHAPGKIAL